jgi:hypothetical protein
LKNSGRTTRRTWRRPSVWSPASGDQRAGHRRFRAWKVAPSPCDCSLSWTIRASPMAWPRRLLTHRTIGRDSNCHGPRACPFFESRCLSRRRRCPDTGEAWPVGTVNHMRLPTLADSHLVSARNDKPAALQLDADPWPGGVPRRHAALCNRMPIKGIGKMRR